PVGRAASIVTATLGSSLSTGLGVGVARTFWQGTQGKWVTGLAGAVVVGVATLLFVHSAVQKVATPPNAPEQSPLAEGAQPPANALPAAQTVDAAIQPGVPDALTLLQGV